MSDRRATGGLSDLAHHLDVTTEELRVVMSDVHQEYIQGDRRGGEITARQARFLRGA